MPQAGQIKRELFSILSWRAEAKAAALPPERGQQVRDRVGRFMSWARAHDSLPLIPDRAAILCFHAVIAHKPDPDVDCEALRVEDFRKLLSLLDRSFRVISLAELVACIRERRSPPPKSVVITFDDGYANNHKVAAEELDRFRMPWSAFLPAQLVEDGTFQWIDDIRMLVHKGGERQLVLRGDEGVIALQLDTPQQRHEAVRTIHKLCRYVPDEERRARLAAIYDAYAPGLIESLRERYRDSFAPMTWQQARQLKAAGVDVGSHSLTHTALGPQTPEAMEYEILEARRLLQERIGDHSPHFSYPYGRMASLSAQTEAMLVQAGYNCALTLEQMAVHCDQVDLLRLPRLIVSPLVGRMVFTLWQRFCR